jgi:hypothetical protein
MAKEKRKQTGVRVLVSAIENCINVAKEIGEPFNYNSVVEQAMLTVTKERIIENLKKQNNEKTSSVSQEG